MTIADTIRQQIGFDARLAVSARDYSYTHNSLTFRYGPRNGLKHYTTITYRAGSDDYLVTALKIKRNLEILQLAHFERVYADDLSHFVRLINNEI
jgi:hypothetical protein